MNCGGDLKPNFDNASESFKRLNPHLFGVGAVAPSQPKPGGLSPAPATDALEKRGSFSLVVSLVSFRRKLLDDDNLSGSCKHLRDAISASLGLDDGDRRIRWEYGQVESRGKTGVAVKIELSNEKGQR